MGKTYNKIRRLCAFLLGAVFFVSGLLKLLDPVGTGLIVGEYLKWMHLGSIVPTANVAGFILSIVETFLGLVLATGLWRRAAAVVTLLMLAFLTSVTVFLVVFNPLMECGCFGEAIHLTHLQSLIKNVVLCLLAIIAFTPMSRLGRPKVHKYVSFGILATAIVAIAVYSALFIPLVDFTDFRPSAHLEAAINYSKDVYEATFIYEKDGEHGRFSLDRLPDSTWTYVRTETSRKEDSDEIIASLPLRDRTGEYCDSVATYGGAIAVSVYNPKKFSAEKWHKVAMFVNNVEEAGFGPLVIVADNGTDLEEYLWTILPEQEVFSIIDNLYFADYKTLITLNRSNGGATYFQDGYIVRKWSARTLPQVQKFTQKYFDEISPSGSAKGRLLFQAFLVYSFAIMLFM